jgi:hypothetical protein
MIAHKRLLELRDGTQSMCMAEQKELVRFYLVRTTSCHDCQSSEIYGYSEEPCRTCRGEDTGFKFYVSR